MGASKQPVRFPFELLALAGMAAVFFGPVLFNARVFLLSDLCFIFYPGYVFFRECVAHGSLPLWNPYTGCGEPFLADPQRGVFYPLNLIYLLLPTSRAVVVSAALHIFLAGAGTYALARVWRVSRLGALLAGVLYAFSSYTITKIEFSSQLGSLTWFPFVLAAFVRWIRHRSRGTFFLLAGTLCLQFLAGHPETQAFGIASLAIYGLFVGFQAWRAREGRTSVVAPLLGLAGAGMVALLLAMAELLPMWEAMRPSVRAGPAEQLLDEWSMHPLGIFSLLIPSIYGTSGLAGTYWAPACYAYSSATFYIGIVPLAVFLAVAIHKSLGSPRTSSPSLAAESQVAVRMPYLLTLSVAFLVYSLGRYTPVHTLLLHAIPVLNRFEGPLKCLPCVVLSLSCLAGIGLDWLAHAADEGSQPRRRWHSVLLGWGGPFAFMVVGLLAAASLWDHGHFGKAVLRHFFNLGLAESRFPHLIQWRTLAQDAVKLPLVGLVSGVLLNGYTYRHRRRSIFGFVLVLLAFADLWITNAYLLHPGPAHFLDDPNTCVGQLRPEGKVVRFLAFQEGPPPGLPPGRTVEALEGTEIRQGQPGSFETIYPLGRRCLHASAAMVHKGFNAYSPHNVFSGDVARVLGLAWDPACALKHQLATWYTHDAVMRLRSAPGVPMSRRECLLSMANCDRILMPPDISKFLVTGTLDPFRLAVLAEPMPRAYVVGGVHVLDDEEDVLTRLAIHPFDPWEVALIDRRSAQGNTFSGLHPGRVKQHLRRLDYGQNSLRIEIESALPGMLVLTDTYYPGWRATVNGEKARIYKVNGAFRGVLVPAGSSEVRMDYRPMSVPVGITISLVTLAGMIILLLPKLGKHPRRDPCLENAR